MKTATAGKRESASVIHSLVRSPKWTWYVVLAVSSLALPLATEAQPSSEPGSKFWHPDGPVRAIAVQGRTVYLGGQFKYVGPLTGGATVVDSVSGEVKQGFPMVKGTVNAAVPDGSGGWYIAGAFWSVGGVLRTNLARVLADNAVDQSWNPQPNNACLAIARIDNTVYVGGNFTRVGGQIRNRLAALDGVTGQLTAWNPGANSSVNALLVSGKTLYLAGGFTSCGNQSRLRVAAVDVDSGTVSSWNPGANSTVNVLALSGSTLYLAGSFTTAGGKPRNRIAALDSQSDVALDWNPNANGVVSGLAVGDGVVYAGGQFTSIGGQNRAYLAALDSSTGLATWWNPLLDDFVSALLIRGPELFVAGSFTSVERQRQPALAKFNLTTGLLSAWDPRVSSLLQSTAPEASLMVSADPALLVAGNFVSIGGVVRSNLAALDRWTGQVTDWNPNADGPVTALAADEAKVYVGGTFSSIGGSARQRLAALDPLSGLPGPWTANVLGRSTVGILTLARDASDRLYVGGNFTNISGQARNGLAALDCLSGSVLAWNPNALAASANSSASVNALVATTNAIYVGGDFVNVGVKARNRIAALNPLNGAATEWNPDANGAVSALALCRSNILVGGLFTTIGGQPRNRLASLNLLNGAPSTWNPDVAGTSAQIWSIVAAGASAYVGGQFTQTGGEFRNRAAGLNLDSARAHHWNPNMNGQIRVLYWTPQDIYAAGDFTSVNNGGSAYFAAFCAQPAFLPETIQRQINGTFLATLRTGEGTRLRVQSSEDCLLWQDVSTHAITGFPVDFEHAAPLSSPCLFYRALLYQD